MQSFKGMSPKNNLRLCFIQVIKMRKGLIVLPAILACCLLTCKTMAQFSEVPVTGFNADIVADGTSNPDATASSTVAIDGAGWIFASGGYYPSAVGSVCNATNGFPSMITSTNATTNTGITYTLQPVDGNNAMHLASAETGTLTLVTPANAAKLYLVCLGGGGAAAFSAQVNFSDATSETLSSTAPDWCVGAATYKITPAEYYRIKRTSVACDGALCPYIYEVPLNISQANFAKTITSISLTNNAVMGTTLNVLAVGRRNGFNPGQTYTTNGDASQDDCHTYTVTNPQSGQSGSVWNNIKIDLSQSFTFLFDVYLGSIDADGADGMAFVLQPISTSIGVTGNGLGFGGVSPSLGVTLDTYQNSIPDSDPVYDHIAIQRNGDLDHLSANNLAGPVQIINGVDNAEDGQWHKLKIVWDSPTHTMEAWIDGSLRVTHTEDIVATTFNNDPLVYWGFTASTGLYYNLQRFRTALEPHWHFGPAQNLCVNQPITFIDSTISFTAIAGVSWDFGDMSPVNTTDMSPTHSYVTPGTYTVTQTVTGADGCEETNTQTVTVGGGIAISSTVSMATCTTTGSVTLQLPATPGPFTITWNTNPVQNGITASNLSPGNYTAMVLDGNGCTSTHTATLGVINTISFVTHIDTTICSGTSFNANTQSNATAFTWTPSNGVSDVNIANPVLSPATTTTYSVHATLQFCDSTRSLTVTVPVVTANAGSDQTINAGSSIQLQASASTGAYLWAPAMGLSAATVLSPLANPGETTTYTLTVTSPEGCMASDEVTVFVKENIDCPEPMSAFTPNGDGINDRWLVGLEACYLNAAVHVYNRYGTAVYENKNYRNNWEGKYKDKTLPDGTYYFVIDFTYSNNKKKQVRGNVTILR